MPKPVWEDKFYIGISYTPGTGTEPGTWEYAPLCAGITGVVPSVNETVDTSYYLCGNGGAQNNVTAIAPQYQVTGHRIEGDAAQDYIAGIKYALGDGRKSSFKVIQHGQQIVADCTISDVIDFGGNTPEINQFSCTIRVNGIPTVTDAE